MSEQMDHRQHLNHAKKLVKAYQDSFDRDMALGHAQALMRNHVKSLILQAEQRQKIADAWLAIELSESAEGFDDFYSTVQDILGGESDE